MYMKKVLLFACCLMWMSAQAADFETATEAVKNMGVGWNLGNTLDAVNGSKQGLESETCWGQPITKPELMKMMKEAGFGAIRVPVTWYNHMDTNGKVDEAWMKRVHEVVDYVINQGLYCIVNVHHDTGDGTQWLHASMNTYNAAKAKYEYLWKQIAEEFKDYDQHLLFEAYNEMLDDKNTWNEPTDKTDGYKAINSYAKSFVTTVRNTGSNNAQRNLVVNVYSASSSGNAMKELDLPEESGHIAFQIHNYPDWQNESHARELVDNLISTIQNNLSNRAPVIIGEYATLCVWPKREYYDDDRALALYAMDYFIKKTKEAGIGTFYWMGLSDGVNRSLPAFHQADLAKTLIKAYHGTLDGFKFPTADDFQVEYIVKYEKDYSEAFLYGDWNSSAKKLSDYKSIRVEMDQSYGAKLQVKIYGDMNGKNADGTDKYKEQCTQLSSTSTTTTINFDASTLGTSLYRITLQTLSGVQTVRVKKATLIKADGSEEPGAISVGWGCAVSSESAPKTTGIQRVATNQQAENDAIYNLSGQRISKPQKGIYIQNGKKYIAK